MQKAFPLLVRKFPLPEGTSHCLKKNATARRKEIPLPKDCTAVIINKKPSVKDDSFRQPQFMGVKVEQDDLNQMFLTGLAPEWLMHTIVWRNRSDLDTLSLDDLYNHLKVYESEVQKKSEPNTQNMTFTSSVKHSRGNDEVNTASVYTASSNVPTTSANVATVNISQETACVYIASQSNGSQIKFKDINQIDEDDMEEMDIKWNMALLSMRADKFWKKTGNKISIQGSDVAGFDKSKVECFNCHKMDHFARECRAPRNQDKKRRDTYRQGCKAKEQAPKALMAIDRVGWDWSYMENDKQDHALVVDEEVPTEFALMANTSTESKGKKECIESLRKELENLKKEKEVVDGKLAGLLTASKDLDNLIESQRPSPTVESSSKEDQNRNPSTSENVASPITPKPFVKFVKTSDSQSKSKTDEKETPKKPPVKDAKQYKKLNKKPNLRGNQRNWNNLKSHQLGPDFVMKKKACFNCGDFNHLAYECRKRGSSQNRIDDKGYWDSGCSRHITGNISYLSDYEPFDGGYISFEQGGRKITRKVTIKTGKLKFENVYFVKDLKYNLFSVSQICDNKNNVLFTDSKCIVLGRDFKLLDDANILLRTPRQDNMYSINLNNIVLHRDLTCLVAKASADEYNIWHMRLGHLNFKTMNKLVMHNLVRGLPTKSFENDHNCTACLKGKQHKASCKSKLVTSMSKPLHTLHMDLFGPTSDETSGILRKFITEIENLKDLKVKIIRCDNRREFRNKELNDFCLQKGIKREFSNARTPQQNGVAERRNRSLIEAARTMLADAKLPVTCWAEAVNTACYVQNRVLVNKAHNKTPYELFNGRTPAIGFLKPFGCLVMILNTLDNLSKFEAKGDEGYFLGYSISRKAFRVFNIRTKRVEENLHIEFLENKAIEKGSGPNWLFDIDSLTKSMNYVPVVDAGTNSTNFLGTKVDARKHVKKDVSSLRYIVLPNWVYEEHLDQPQDACNTDAPESSGNSNPTATSTNPPTDQLETLTVET
nr:hypothetical protein [Tanacetum cinerariifolium]